MDREMMLLPLFGQVLLTFYVGVVARLRREKAVKDQLRATKRSAILMSSSRELLICKPGPRGWRTKTLLNFECLTLEDSTRQVAERLADRDVVEGKLTGQVIHEFLAILEVLLRVVLADHSVGQYTAQRHVW